MNKSVALMKIGAAVEHSGPFNQIFPILSREQKEKAQHFHF